MATIPQAIDYGARPSLRSGRVDVPGSGELAIVDAVENAANKFNDLLKERQTKRDALAYANAKSELLSEDIRLRRSFKEDEDYATFEERYREGMTAARERVTPTIIDRYDRALFDADANLTVERGVSAVTEIGRVKRVDKENADLISNLEQARADLLAADPVTRNDILQNALDGITAAESKGNLLDVEAEKMRLSFVKNVAEAELMMMDPLAREEALKVSIAANPSKDDIKAGKGTGSLADFLHPDEKIEMLRKAQLENKTTRDNTKAFGVVDKAFELHPGLGNEGARMAYIRKTLKNDPDARAIADRQGRLRNNSESRIAQATVQEIMRENGRRMREEEDFTYDDIPAQEKSQLSPQQDALMKQYSQSLQNGEQFGAFDNWHEAKYDKAGNLVLGSYDLWGDMSLEEKAAIELSDPEWAMAFTESVWRTLENEQRAINAGTITQDYGPTDDQLLQSFVVGQGILPKTGLDVDEDSAYQRLRFRFKDEIDVVRQREFAGGKVPYQRRRDILFEIISQTAYERDAGLFGFDAKLFGTEAIPIFKMTEAQVEAGFIPISQVREAMTSVNVNGVAVPMTWEQRLKNLALSDLDGRQATQKDIENAYFAVLANLGPQEIRRRLSGKGDE